jgi:nickel transport protein
VKSGAQLLVIDHSEPSAVPGQANADLYNATLWFSVSDR